MRSFSATLEALPDGGVDVALRDGSTLCVRRVGGEDRPAMQAFLQGLSLESIGFRFFGQVNIGWATDWSTEPIVAVKSGRSPAGARASASHTGALLAGSDVTVDALFRQAGVIRTDTMHELFDVGALLSNQPIPAGSRVAIVTNVGGPGILCADACAAAGLDVVELSGELRGRLGAFLAPQAALSNPIDMIATASPQDYRRTLEELVASGECDAVITIFVPPLQASAREVAREIRAAAKQAQGVTLAAVYMNSEGAPHSRAGSGRVPSFEYPEDAARALGHAAGYARWRAQPLGRVPELAGCRRVEAAAIISEALGSGGGWMAAGQASALLECYGLPLIASRVAGGPQEAAAAAVELGFPVALKGLASGLLHKSDVGAVRLALHGAEAVRAAAQEILGAVSAAGHEPRGLLVQRMAPAGVELLMGVVHDASFGPVIACGAGGTSAELMKDVAVRITPLTDLDATEMLRSLRTFPLLEGYRGAPGADVGAVEEALLRLSALVEAHPEVAELDANPLVACAQGAVIVDARIRLAPVAPRRPLPSL